MRVKKNSGMGDFIDDALAFNTGSPASSSSDDSFLPSDISTPNFELPDTLEPPPESPSSSSFNAEDIFSALSVFAKDVAVPIYAASKRSDDQERALDYQYKIEQLRSSNPFSRFTGTGNTRITGGLPRTYSQGGNTSLGIFPWLLVGAVGIGALFFVVKK